MDEVGDTGARVKRHGAKRVAESSMRRESIGLLKEYFVARWEAGYSLGACRPKVGQGPQWLEPGPVMARMVR